MTTLPSESAPRTVCVLVEEEDELTRRRREEEDRRRKEQGRQDELTKDVIDRQVDDRRKRITDRKNQLNKLLELAAERPQCQRHEDKTCAEWWAGAKNLWDGRERLWYRIGCRLPAKEFCEPCQLHWLLQAAGYAARDLYAHESNFGWRLLFDEDYERPTKTLPNVRLP